MRLILLYFFIYYDEQAKWKIAIIPAKTTLTFFIGKIFIRRILYLLVPLSKNLSLIKKIILAIFGL